MPYKERDISKLYYTMGEVSAMFDVNQSLLRFYEKEFDILQPKKNKKGNRYFTPEDIENLKIIFNLIRDKGYTLQGAIIVMKQFDLDLHIDGCKKGDRKSQAAIYKHFASKMFALCMRYTHDKMEAEDILQEGFVKVFTKIHLYSGEGNFEGWMRSIMVNTALTVYRANQRRVPTTNIEIVDYSIHYNTTSDSNDAQYLLDSLNNLPANYRIPFNLFAIEGYSHKEIADKMGISVMQSRTQVCRARTVLRDSIRNAQVAPVSKMQLMSA